MGLAYLPPARMLGNKKVSGVTFLRVYVFKYDILERAKQVLRNNFITVEFLKREAVG